MFIFQDFQKLTQLQSQILASPVPPIGFRPWELFNKSWSPEHIWGCLSRFWVILSWAEMNEFTAI